MTKIAPKKTIYSTMVKVLISPAWMCLTFLFERKSNKVRDLPSDKYHVRVTDQKLVFRLSWLLLFFILGFLRFWNTTILFSSDYCFFFYFTFFTLSLTFFSRIIWGDGLLVNGLSAVHSWRKAEVEFRRCGQFLVLRTPSSWCSF